MFEKLLLKKTIIDKQYNSTYISDTDLQDIHADKNDLLNNNFIVSGSADGTPHLPISDFAMENLYTAQGLSIFHYQADNYTERQKHAFYLLAYTMAGEGSLTYHNKTYALSEGSVFFLDCMDYHCYKVVGRSWDLAVMHFNGVNMPAFYKLFLDSHEPVFTAAPNSQFLKDFEEVAYLSSSPQLFRDWQVSDSISTMLTHMLVSNLDSKSSNKNIPEYIRYLMQYIEHNYTGDLTLDYLADFSRMDKFHLAKEFKKYTGFSPYDYLISVRIEEAKHLLKATSLPAVKIAALVGVTDFTNFTRLFKKRVGMTPTKYRNTII